MCLPSTGANQQITSKQNMSQGDTSPREKLQLQVLQALSLEVSSPKLPTWNCWSSPWRGFFPSNVLRCIRKFYVVKDPFLAFDPEALIPDVGDITSTELAPAQLLPISYSRRCVQNYFLLQPAHILSQGSIKLHTTTIHKPPLCSFPLASWCLSVSFNQWLFTTAGRGMYQLPRFTEYVYRPKLLPSTWTRISAKLYLN
jgi:hypothetical protein